MSFNKCPPAVITEILSHLLDVRSKIRLERVSKNFRDCIRDQEAWKRNTTLEMGQFGWRGGSDRGLRFFLSHATEINTLSLRYDEDDGAGGSEMMATLFEFERKLKIDRLQVSTTSGYGSPYCLDDGYVLAGCLGKFHKSLKSLDLSCCWQYDCSLLKTFTSLLPRCSNLKHLTLRQFNDQEPSAGHGEGNRIIPVLSQLNLESLHLVDFHNNINSHSLAAVFNDTQEHSIRSLRVENTREDSMSFSFAQFVNELNPPAALALTSMELLGVSHTNWIEVFGTLPTKLPNLSRIAIRDDLRPEQLGESSRMAMRYAKCIGQFLHSCLDRRNRLHARLVLFVTDEFSSWFWSSVNLIEVRRSVTKRNASRGWKRTVTNKNGTLDLEMHEPYY